MKAEPRASAGSPRPRRGARDDAHETRAGFKRLVRLTAAAFAEHRLSTYASAIAFRVLVALIPLTLLALGLLGAVGLEDVWEDSVAPPIEKRVSEPVFAAIDFSVEKIFTSGAGSLVTFAALLALWHLTWGVRVIMEALNAIHDVDEQRSWIRCLLVALALACAVALCFIGSLLVVAAAPRLGGAAQLLLGLGRWLIAVCLLALAVGLLVRYAPAEHPQPRWASAGSVLVVGAWIAASLLFGWWAGSIANFKTAIGSLTVLLALTAYLFTSAAIFLVGVQLDELLRKESQLVGRGPADLLRRARTP